METATAMTLESVRRLTRDLKKAAVTLSRDEARYLCDLYYSMQHNRITSANQVRALTASGEPHEVLTWFGEQSDTLETQIKNALHSYAAGNPTGQWALSICGIGPVISAGLLANVRLQVWRCLENQADLSVEACREREPHDGPGCRLERIRTVSAIWRYAGLDPTLSWEKGQKRPWNASLKVLAFKIGDSFIKQQSNKSDYYGKLYAVRRRYEGEKNEAGHYADQAAAILQKKRIGRTTEAYKYYSAGKLPPAHLLSRARRWAVKLFLSHWFEVAYWYEWGERPVKPYVFSVLGHADEIAVPNAPW